LPLSTLLRHIGEIKVELQSFVTSALDGGEWSTSHAAAIFAPGKKKAIFFEEHVNPTVQINFRGPYILYRVIIVTSALHKLVTL